MNARVSTYIIMCVTALLTVSCGADHYMKKGEKFLAIGEYYDAAEEFKVAYNKTPTKERAKRGERARKLAYCYDRINSNSKAIAAYRNVIRYKKDSTDTHLALARLLMKAASYKEAAKEFQLVLDSLPDNELAKTGLLAAQTAQAEKEAGSRYIVKKMDIFNSRRADYSPMLFGDEYDQLYFTSTRNEAQGDELSGITGTKPGDIFFSQNVSSSIAVAKVIGAVTHEMRGRGIDVQYFTPLQIKMAITGIGRADKNQVQQMVALLLKMDSIPRPDHAADALADCITYAVMNSTRQRMGGKLR